MARVGEGEARRGPARPARPLARRHRRPARRPPRRRDRLQLPAGEPAAAQGARLLRVHPGGGGALGRHAARRPEGRGRRRPRHARAGRGRHRHAAGAAAVRRFRGLHLRPHLVEQRRPPVGRRHDEGLRPAQHAPGDGAHEPAGPRRRALADAGGGRGPPRPQVRLRLRRARGRRHPVGLERQSLPGDRQRGDHRLQPARRDGEARDGRRGRLRGLLRGGGALPRRLRARAGGPRGPVRAAVLGTPGRDRPHEADRPAAGRAPRRRRRRRCPTSG